MDRLFFMSATLIASLALGAASASAEQVVKHVAGKQVIVHTSAAPVIVHRLLPPYLGKHVTERQLNSGRLPRGLRK